MPKQINLDKNPKLELQMEHGGTLSVEYHKEKNGEDGDGGGNGENLGKLRKEVSKGLDHLALRGELELFVVRDLHDDGIRWERLRGKEQHEKVPPLFEIYNRSGKDGLNLNQLLQKIKDFSSAGSLS